MHKIFGTKEDASYLDREEFMWVEYEQLKDKMFAEMQNWAIEQAKNFLKQR